ncbi:pur operon repressor [Abyssisolibacter fermentans]|uniref:pur operon repressor n=1 Tax=Abyssisolibacter fermentans TaxID=1766203 RepID=UPI00082FDFE2|nr:pur operon repressor [Abyssisolibacter fermentans]
MDKLKRNERIGALMNILTDNPNTIFTYNYFNEKFDAAKSTISEDIVIVKKLVTKLKLGDIETLSGVSGGVRYLPILDNEQIMDFTNKMCKNLSQGNRVIAGGFIYMIDLLYSPDLVYNIGKIFYSIFSKKEIDYIITVETKGIPIALMTAKVFNKPLIIIRKDAKITEGPTVSINYVSGSTRKIQTMSLARKAMKEGSKILVIDDFMRAGGTVKGIYDMMKEFNAEVVGTGILISTEHPEEKVVDDYVSLLTLKNIDEIAKNVEITANNNIFID